MSKLQLTFGKVAFIILSLIATGYFLFFALIAIAFGAPLPSVILIVFILFTLIIGLYQGIWYRNFLKRNFKYYLLFLLVPIIGLVGFHTYQRYDDSIPKLSDEVDIRKYQPFKDKISNPELAKLNNPATLKFTTNLPRIDCATALYPIASSFVEAIYPDNIDYHPYKNETIPLLVSQTPVAYENLFNKKVDLILVAGPSKKQESEATGKGVQMVLTPIGKEGFVFFVNSKNPVDNLTLEQIQDIYSGKITNWKDVGGSNESIRPFQRPEKSGSQTALEKLMGGKPLLIPPTEDRVAGMGGIIKVTAAYKNYNTALGFSFRYYSTQMVKNNEIKLLKINGIAPTEENIRNGTYPLSSNFYAITLADNPNPNTQKLLEWVLSSEGQELIQKTGYTPIR